jgi:hypothetical protein
LVRKMTPIEWAAAACLFTDLNLIACATSLFVFVERDM